MMLKCYNHNLLPSVRQPREDPQKKGNIESGRKEKLELIFFSGTSPEIWIDDVLDSVVCTCDCASAIAFFCSGEPRACPPRD